VAKLTPELKNISRRAIFGNFKQFRAISSPIFDGNTKALLGVFP